MSAPLHIGITGASGLVGTALTARLTAAGHTVHPFVRRAARPGTHEIAWQPAQGQLEVAALAPLDVVINLAGENIGDGRWTQPRKRLIVESRVAGTRLLAEALSALAAGSERPRALVQASAIGFYGDTGDRPVDEDAPPGEGFLAEVCCAWEEAAAPVVRAGVRLAVARIGVVLSPSGGALARMLPPFRAGVGGPLGSGRQYLSWIHLDDTTAALAHLATSGARGVFNLTAPGAVPQADFARALGEALHRPARLPAPAVALRLLFGEMADEMLLAGARVRPDRLRAGHFDFAYPELSGALRACLRPDGGAVSPTEPRVSTP
jgi:uncharacterized protein (TIGR01777 family)